MITREATMSRRMPRRSERGAMAVEFMLVVSVLIAVFLLMLQYAVRAHAERIASAAADQGLAAASSYHGTPAVGRQVARDYLTRLGPGLHGASVAARRTNTFATITVSGKVDQLIPFLAVRVHVHVQGPVERFVPSQTSLGAPP